MTASHSSSDMLNNIRSRVIPALFTTMLIPPSASALLTSSSAVERWLTSPATATAFDPAAVISSMTSEASSAPAMSLTTTAAPARAKPIASARPRPAAAPVTTATFPDRSVAFVLVVNLRIPLVFAGQSSARALDDRPLGQLLLLGRDWVGLHHGV